MTETNEISSIAERLGSDILRSKSASFRMERGGHRLAQDIRGPGAQSAPSETVSKAPGPQSAPAEEPRIEPEAAFHRLGWIPEVKMLDLSQESSSSEDQAWPFPRANFSYKFPLKCYSYTCSQVEVFENIKAFPLFGRSL